MGCTVQAVPFLQLPAVGQNAQGHTDRSPHYPTSRPLSSGWLQGRSVDAGPGRCTVRPDPGGVAGVRHAERLQPGAAGLDECPGKRSAAPRGDGDAPLGPPGSTAHAPPHSSPTFSPQKRKVGAPL